MRKDNITPSSLPPESSSGSGDKKDRSQTNGYGKMAFPWLLTIAVTFISLGLFIPPHIRGVIEACEKDPPIELPLSLVSNDKNKAGGNENASFVVDPCQVYSLSYGDARDKFRQTVQQLRYYNKGIELHTLSIFKEDGMIAKSKEDETDEQVSSSSINYTTDIAVIPCSGTSGSSNGGYVHAPVVIHMSGLHGVEGYAGSAIQLAILNQLLYTYQLQQLHNVGGTGLQSSSSSTTTTIKPTIVLIHAVNPYGMYHYRRTNENNVDLNRNAIRHDAKDSSDNDSKKKKKKSGDSSNTPFDPSFFQILDDFKAKYSQKPTYYDMTLGYAIRTIKLLTTYGYDRVKRVFVTGQYTDPEALLYGGHEDAMEASLQQLFQFLTQTKPELLKNTKLLIDVHTGLGPFGKDTLSFKWSENDKTTSEQDSSTNINDTDVGGAMNFTSLFPSAYDMVTPLSKEKGAMSGYEHAKGFVTGYLEEEQKSIVERIMSEDVECQAGSPDDAEEKQCSPQSIEHKKEEKRHNIFMVQEFGTIPGILVARALSLENWVFQYMKLEKTKVLNYLQKQQLDDTNDLRISLTRGAFYPQSTKWRRSIVQRGVSLFQHGIDFATTSTSTEDTIAGV